MITDGAAEPVYELRGYALWQRMHADREGEIWQIVITDVRALLQCGQELIDYRDRLLLRSIRGKDMNARVSSRPRCDECRWWAHNEPLPRDQDRWGRCALAASHAGDDIDERFLVDSRGVAARTVFTDNVLDTRNDFGCVQFQVKT